MLKQHQSDKHENEHQFTHNYFLPTAIVGFLHYRRVEVIKVEFSLECDLVICVEEVESEHGPGSVKGGRVPPHL